MPIALAYVARSGVTPKYSAAPPLAIRKPVLTSSKMSSDAELLRERAHLLVEALAREDRLGVAEDRLDDDRGDVVAVALEDPAQDVDRG